MHMALFDQSSADVSGSPVDVNLLLFFFRWFWLVASVPARVGCVVLCALGLTSRLFGSRVFCECEQCVHWCCRWGAVTHLCCVTLLWFISPCCLCERATPWQLLDLCVSPWRFAFLLCSCAVLLYVEWMVVLSDCIHKWKVFCLLNLPCSLSLQQSLHSVVSHCCVFLCRRWRSPPRRWLTFLCTLWASTARQRARDTKAKSISESAFVYRAKCEIIIIDWLQMRDWEYVPPEPTVFHDSKCFSFFLAI